MEPDKASREYLEDLWKVARQQLPGWLYAWIRNQARASAGGRAAHRVDEPDVLHKMALTAITPDSLSKIEDDDLFAVWLRLSQWYSNAKRRKASVENIVNAALWTKQELERRGKKIKPSDMVDAISTIEATAKERSESVHGKESAIPKLLGDMLKNCPSEILLCRDWVAVAGSAAVAEKPNDIDVVVRSEYNSKSGKYEIDGAGLWVALRRFLSPTKKSGPQIQLLSSPQGSFTDYVPIFDLVVRKRVPHVVKIEPSPPAYEDRGRVIKQIKPFSQISEQAERAKRKNALTSGEFFYQPKPTRPAKEGELMTVDSLVNLYAENKDNWLPAFVQKKYDGANHQAHKTGDEVTIYSEDGEDNTDRLTGLVEAIRKLKADRLVFTFELEKWDGKQHLPREAVSGYLAEKSDPDDSDLVANVYDLLLVDDTDIHDKPLHERLVALENIGIKQSTMDAPDLSQRLNIAPSIKVFNTKQLREQTEKIRKLDGSEGVVVKKYDSTYPLEKVTKDTWVKYHNATVIRAVSIKSNRTKGGSYTVDYGVLPGKDKAYQLVTIGMEKIVPVGTSFSSSRRFDAGDQILIEAETVNKIVSTQGVELSAWVPRVIGDYSDEADTVDDVVNDASVNLVLQTKIVDDKGAVVSYLPANVIKVNEKPDTPAIGKKNAVVAFVGASPGKVDAARGEPFTGPAGETLNDLYIKPLGLTRADVLLINAVPMLLTDADGKVREPDVEEVKAWRDWLHGKLDELTPRIIIALGRTAEAALDGRSDFVLPHPSAVRRFGDSGEVSRKLKRVAEKIKSTDKKSSVEKQIPEPLIKPVDEGGTRSIAAFRNWENNFDKMLPSKGKGRFVYMHHWRGLDEKLSQADESELIKTDHSLHGDLRLEGDDGLWGWAVLLGKTEDNRDRKDFDKLIDWQDGDNIELAPKIRQPKEWLDVGEKEPLVTGPGEVGSTAEKYSKFFGIDRGSYQLGVARKHMVEIFLDGDKLKGRYLLQFAPVAGRRRWLIDKPNDQTPMVESRDLADLISELRQKKQRWLFWGGPGKATQKIDVNRGQVVKSTLCNISKADEEKRIVYGIVLDPYGEDGPSEDAHGDWTPPGDVEKSAHDYMISSRVVGLQHKGKADAQVVESWVEQYPSRADYLSALRSEPHEVWVRPFGSDVIHSGAWALGVKLGEKEWKLYKDGKINAFSPGGYGVRTPIDRGKMPDVKFKVLEYKKKRDSI